MRLTRRMRLRTGRVLACCRAAGRRSCDSQRGSGHYSLVAPAILSDNETCIFWNAGIIRIMETSRCELNAGSPAMRGSRMPGARGTRSLPGSHAIEKRGPRNDEGTRVCWHMEGPAPHGASPGHVRLPGVLAARGTHGACGRRGSHNRDVGWRRRAGHEQSGEFVPGLSQQEDQSGEQERKISA
jgi:hypothetical protein